MCIEDMNTDIDHIYELNMKTLKLYMLLII